MDQLETWVEDVMAAANVAPSAKLDSSSQLTSSSQLSPPSQLDPLAQPHLSTRSHLLLEQHSSAQPHPSSQLPLTSQLQPFTYPQLSHIPLPNYPFVPCYLPQLICLLCYKHPPLQPISQIEQTKRRSSHECSYSLFWRPADSCENGWG